MLVAAEQLARHVFELNGAAIALARDDVTNLVPEDAAIDGTSEHEKWGTRSPKKGNPF